MSDRTGIVGRVGPRGDRARDTGNAMQSTERKRKAGRHDGRFSFCRSFDILTASGHASRKAPPCSTRIVCVSLSHSSRFLLRFQAAELDMPAKTADALSAYLGKPVLAEVGTADDGLEWVTFGIPLDSDALNGGEHDPVRVQMGGLDARLLGSRGGLTGTDEQAYDCLYLWAIQITLAEGERFVKLTRTAKNPPGPIPWPTYCLSRCPMKTSPRSKTTMTKTTMKRTTAAPATAAAARPPLVRPSPAGKYRHAGIAGARSRRTPLSARAWFNSDRRSDRITYSATRRWSRPCLPKSCAPPWHCWPLALPCQAWRK